MPAFTFTQEELDYLKRTAAKLMSIRKELSPKDWKKPQNQTVKGLAEKFKTESTVEQTFILGRNSMRAIQELMQAGIKTLDEATIPEYERRISSQPEQKEFYQPYLDKAVGLRTLFKGLLDKVEKEL